MNLPEQLTAGYQTGFIDCNYTSLEKYHPKLIVNDHKRGMRVLTSLVNELQLCDEFYFSVAFISNSGVAALVSVLEELEKGGRVKGKILTSQYLNFTQPKALRRLLQFRNIELRIVTEGSFHAKGYIFKKNDQYSFIIGSSNLTQEALGSNKEWNIKLSSLENGLVMQNIRREFEYAFDNATIVDESWIQEYEKIYREIQSRQRAANTVAIQRINPNDMQIDALRALQLLHNDGKRKALLISATGTGKTYLSAFDAARINPKRLLFVVHRENIARASMQSYRRIFGDSKTMGLLTGNTKDVQKDFLFSTIQTLSKNATLQQFASDYFDYIVIDEVHRSGAASYQKILEHFRPAFLLGMSATPERTDQYDIFKLFDYNIAYEIRLGQALEQNMLSPFHYYGVSELEIDGKPIDEFSEFNLLTCPERVERIIEKARFFGCDNGRVKGLIFCSRVQEARALSAEFNSRGFSTICLDGDSSEADRETAIKNLERDGHEDQLDYIFTVDIFNEGVDIPSVNQVIMLRPTQSAIIFVQQLGRGLRKYPGKEYLTVIDFIGNYTNNYMVPIALYGDRSYNKDTIRRLITSGSSVIPGCSTVNFDHISKERIFKSLNSNNISKRTDLIKDFELLRFELGRLPMMMDFLEHGRREPYAFTEPPYGSYYGFVRRIQTQDIEAVSEVQEKILGFYTREILDGKRVEESMLLAILLANGSVSEKEFAETIYSQFEYKPTAATIASAVRCLNGRFLKETARHQYGIKDNIEIDKSVIRMASHYRDKLLQSEFHRWLDDQLRYSFARYKRDFSKESYRDGFLLYQKYGRKDVCRILNWEKNEESTVYGYRIKYNTCPIFVTYEKNDDRSDTIKYADRFLNTHKFSWMTRNRLTLQSQEVRLLQKSKELNLRIPLFVKKNDDEGKDFYYMGDLVPEAFEQTTIRDGSKNVEYPIVNILFQMKDSVEDSLYNYLENGSEGLELSSNN